MITREDMRQSGAAFAASMRELARDLLICLRFCTRLPIRPLPFETAPYQPLAGAARALPLAGALIGLGGAICLAIAHGLGLPAPLPVLLGLTGLIVLTGALHEDGLADCADGFAGGRTREARLAIMKDSRLGTFGTLALILALLIRAASLTAIAGKSEVLAGLVMIAANATSRAFALAPLWLLPPARQDGAGLANAQPSRAVLFCAAASALVLALLPIAGGADLKRVVFSCLAGAVAAVSVTLAARRAIGGQTGDVAGATQQIAEICSYLIFAARN